MLLKWSEACRYLFRNQFPLKQMYLSIYIKIISPAYVADFSSGVRESMSICYCTRVLAVIKCTHVFMREWKANP